MSDHLACPEAPQHPPVVNCHDREEVMCQCDSEASALWLRDREDES
jgi:hypothetical protein